MTNIPGAGEGLKRPYHAPMVHEFGSVSETTMNFDFFTDSQIPTWCKDPNGGPPGGGLS